MEHDAPRVLFRLACEQLRGAQIIRLGVVTLVGRVAAAREAAREETYRRVEPLLAQKRRQELDALLLVDADMEESRLAWLGHGPTQASPKAIMAELAKLAFLRGLDADSLDLTALPKERRAAKAGMRRSIRTKGASGTRRRASASMPADRSAPTARWPRPRNQAMSRPGPQPASRMHRARPGCCASNGARKAVRMASSGNAQVRSANRTAMRSYVSIVSRCGIFSPTTASLPVLRTPSP